MIAITVATSQVGLALYDQLKCVSSKIRLIGRSDDRLRRSLRLGDEIVTCDLSNRVELADALKGVVQVCLILPTDIFSSDCESEQLFLADNFLHGLQHSGVRGIVLLSRTGPDRSGTPTLCTPLRYLEAGLSQLPHAYVKVVRSSPFITNLYMSVSGVRSAGIWAGGERADLEVFRLTPTHVARRLADVLLQPYSDTFALENLVGVCPVSMERVVSYVRSHSVFTSLRYVALPESMLRANLMQFGMTRRTASLFIETWRFQNDGWALSTEAPQVTVGSRDDWKVFLESDLLPVLIGSV